jgi:hypothetical protein
MDTSVRDPDIDRWFPAAFEDGYLLTSGIDTDYNCIAWAAGVFNSIWWPTPIKILGVSWPDGVPAEETLVAFMQAYATLGYEDCGNNGKLERGYEKIAVYVDPLGKPTHAARQLYDGSWASKLGGHRDIHHTTPGALETTRKGATEYGTVTRYMRRKRRPTHICLRDPATPDMPPPVDKKGCLFSLIVRALGR